MCLAAKDYKIERSHEEVDFGYPSIKGLTIEVRSCEEEELKQLGSVSVWSHVRQSNLSSEGLWKSIEEFVSEK